MNIPFFGKYDLGNFAPTFSQDRNNVWRTTSGVQIRSEIILFKLNPELKSKILKGVIVIVTIYLFLLSIKLLGHSFKLFGKEFAEAMLQMTSNPFAGLLIGVVATSLIQSSSTTRRFTRARKTGSESMRYPCHLRRRIATWPAPMRGSRADYERLHSYTRRKQALRQFRRRR